MSLVIKIENLYKEYRLGVIGRGTLYRDLQSAWAKFRNKEDPNSIIGREDELISLKNKSFLALKNINLDIAEGEVLGVIGANGAGKSTLLKLISRITSPTKGTIKIKGKVASLLEVGIGFHGEMTGVENIYLNGTMNGMTKKKIKEKIGDILEFAGIAEFAETPVKRYSSGMFVRLGFAVAAFLDADILIVDEVLAVGDASFQSKAISKMDDISKRNNKTVIFVSHNMESIKQLCSSVVILQEGRIIDSGNTKAMIEKYLSGKKLITKNYGYKKWNKDGPGPGGSIIKLKSICTKKINGEIHSNFNINEDVVVEFQFWVLKEGYQVCSQLTFSRDKNDIFQTFDEYIQGDWGKQKTFNTGLYKSSCTIPGNFFNDGLIDINILIFLPPRDTESSFQVMEPKRACGIISFNIIDVFDLNNPKGNYPYSWSVYSSIRYKPKWKSNIIENNET